MKKQRTGAGMSLIGLGGVAAMLALAGSAHAESCGAVQAGWNVPAGGGVYTAGPGPFFSAMTAIGEFYSHSMLSRGPDGWVTQATADTPPRASGGFCGISCSNPIDASFLYASTPGLEWIGQGAAYEQIYGGAGQYDTGYHDGTSSWNGPNAPTLLSADWNSGPGLNGNTWGDTFQTPGTWSGGTVFITQYNGTPVHYGWHQLKNVVNTPQGIPSTLPRAGGGTGLTAGVDCSSSLSLWQHDALSPDADNSLAGQYFINGYGQQQAWMYSGDVYPRGYAPTVVDNAANAMWNAVYNECIGAVTGMFNQLGDSLSGAVASTGVFWCCFGAQNYYNWGLGRLCSNAANQMLNCFAGDAHGNADCGDSSAAWKNNAPAANVWGWAAVSISPDDIFGYDSNGTGAPTVGNGASIWGNDPEYEVQFNTGGYDYSCWD